MRIGAYNPYLHTRGGGERYFLEACRVLSRRHSVDVLVPPGPRSVEELVAELHRTFGLDLERLRFHPLAAGVQPKVALREFDAVLSVSNNWPMVGAKRPHVAILQFPWGIASWSWKRRCKAAWAIHRTDRVLVYSQYTRRHVESLPWAHCTVVNPAVAPVPSGSEPKELLILAVGRFVAAGHNKKHAQLIDAYGVASRSLPGWRLALAGSLGDGDAAYLHSLRQRAAGLAVEFFPNASRLELESLYRRSSLFWHGAGLDEDPQRHPELMEHFGIVAVEAMSVGTVPLVFSGGGLPEIVVDGECGLLWSTPDELVRLTVELASDDARRQAMATRACERVHVFSAEAFARNFEAALPSGMR